MQARLFDCRRLLVTSLIHSNARAARTRKVVVLSVDGVNASVYEAAQKTGFIHRMNGACLYKELGWSKFGLV